MNAHKHVHKTCNQAGLKDNQAYIHPQYFDQLGIKFDGMFYFDKCLPFGFSTSYNIFDRFSLILLKLK